MQKELSILAKRIRKARLDAHISQAELGNAVGVSDKSVSSYEQGRSIPTLDTLHKIAEKTNRPTYYFTNEDAVDAEVAARLSRIEKYQNDIDKDLAEVKRLLNNKK